MPRQTPFLSKSKYLNGLQCPKLLWYLFHRRREVPPPDAGTLALFEEGRKVGGLARRLFPGGEEIAFEYSPEKKSAGSLARLDRRAPLYEAGFTHGRAYALADILVPADPGAWDLYEVKSSTEVKDQHLLDIAFQKYTFGGAGLKVRRCFAVTINSDYLRQGPIEVDKLFNIRDVSAEVGERLPLVEPQLTELLAVVDSEVMPEIGIGMHCGKPYDCPLRGLCEAFLPEKGNILSLTRGGRLKYELLDRGITLVADIPENYELSERQRIQVASNRAGREHIDHKEIARFLETLEYPLFFLDFEAISPAIPVYDQTRPYQSVPFQFSVHEVKKEGGLPIHHSFLAQGLVDPRPELLKRLKELFGQAGSIVAYHAAYEMRCLKNASEAYPEYANWYKRIEPRFVDLLEPFKKFDYYNPKQEGSASLKSVLPALTGKDYKGLEIADGKMANKEYSRVTFGLDIDEADRRQVRQALEKYCCLDTEGLIDVLRVLKKECKA